MNAGPKTYRGWAIDFDYGRYTATGPDYDASYEGEEDGWVDNGHRTEARTLEGLYAEVDCWFTEHCEHCDGTGKVWNNADPTSGQWVPCMECLPPVQQAVSPMPPFPHAPAPGFVQFLYWDRPSSPSWNIYFSRPWSSPLDERLSRRVGNEEALWFFCRQFAFRDENGTIYGPFRPVDALGNPAPDSWFEERK